MLCVCFGVRPLRGLPPPPPLWFWGSLLALVLVVDSLSWRRIHPFIRFFDRSNEHEWFDQMNELIDRMSESLDRMNMSLDRMNMSLDFE